jgi:asparagine synthase (glutamine-hydrolysing)
MCGIAGIVDWSGRPAQESVEAMVRNLRHRGPDAQRVAVRGEATLGHARLSIIDVSTDANQPMADADGSLWLIFNGEIYNYLELKDELAAAGYPFRTKSDSEVILAAWRRWGEACFARFNGMFALALWDERARKLVLARDRLGKKPLFYRAQPERIAFASELPALRCDPATPSAIDPAALRQFVTLGYVLGSHSIVAGVTKLPPAHYMVFESGRAPRLERYWDLAPHFHTKSTWRSEAEACEALRELLRDSVRLRLQSDVPLGAFLSGGIDSSLVVATMARAMGLPLINTFSAGFRDPSFNEATQAGRVATHLKVNHHDRLIEEDVIGELPLLMRRAGEPFADTSMLPMFHLAAFARQTVTVSLSGDGADEAFAGYDTYVADKLHTLLSAVPRPMLDMTALAVDRFWPVSHAKVSLDYRVRQFLAGRRLDFAQAHYSWRRLFDDAEARRLVRPEAWAADADPYRRFGDLAGEVRGCHYLDQAAHIDIGTWLVDDILVKVDRATMAHGLEARAPFLDYRLVEFAARLPVAMKLRGFEQKAILKRLFRDMLPANLLPRRKRGFNAPVAGWFAGPGYDAARSFTGTARLDEWVDRTEVDRLWSEHRAGRRDNGFRLFALACLGAWLMDGDPQAQTVPAEGPALVR